MKPGIRTVFFLVVMGLIFQSCGDDPVPTPPKSAEELATEALAGTGTQIWTLSGGGAVKKDDTDVSSLFAGFELTLNAGSTKTYASKNSNGLMDPTGTWAFAGTNFDKFTLSGTLPAAGREISFTQTGSNLTLVFSIPQPGARLAESQALVGTYTFLLLKK